MPTGEGGSNVVLKIEVHQTKKACGPWQTFKVLANTRLEDLFEKLACYSLLIRKMGFLDKPIDCPPDTIQNLRSLRELMAAAPIAKQFWKLVFFENVFYVSSKSHSFSRYFCLFL